MLNSPLSPHLSIYKPQITSASSIIGRLCGIYTYIFLLIVFWVSIFSIYTYSTPTVPFYNIFVQIKIAKPVVSVLAHLLAFVSVFCVTFYTGTLIRHIFWDYNTFLSLKSASIFGYCIVVVSIFTSIASVALLAIS